MSRARLLSFSTSTRDSSIRAVYLDSSGRTRSCLADLHGDRLVWGYSPTLGDASDLVDDVLQCLRAGAEFATPGIEWLGDETPAEMDRACMCLCDSCGDRVESLDDLSPEGECNGCFFATMAEASAPLEHVGGDWSVAHHVAVAA